MLSGPPVSGTVGAAELLDRFLAGSPRQRRSLLPQVEARAREILPLIDERLDRLNSAGDDWGAGFLIQLLHACGDPGQWEAFQARHPRGWLDTPSAAGQDYAPLQGHLVRQEFEAADGLTSDHLRRLAGVAAVGRGYVYYSEVSAIPEADLESLDRLWLCYSRGRFGFSVQGRLLRACQGQWEQLWPRLGWKSNGVWTRYPTAFTWSLEAPEGHMPLINQLRGVRLMDALLHHPALERRTDLFMGQSAG